jgi:hypothetical protein
MLSLFFWLIGATHILRAHHILATLFTHSLTKQNRNLNIRALSEALEKTLRECGLYEPDEVFYRHISKTVFVTIIFYFASRFAFDRFSDRNLFIFITIIIIICLQFNMFNEYFFVVVVFFFFFFSISKKILSLQINAFESKRMDEKGNKYWED